MILKSFMNGFATTTGALAAVGLGALLVKYYFHYIKIINKSETEPQIPPPTPNLYDLKMDDLEYLLGPDNKSRLI